MLLSFPWFMLLSFPLAYEKQKKENKINQRKRQHKTKEKTTT
jgi:hypothetical protein